MKFVVAHSAIVAAMLVVGTLAMPLRASAQSDGQGFDPAHPFAHIASAEQWVNKFMTGKPDIVAGDAFGNMTGAEWWRDSWEGQNLDHPYRAQRRGHP